MLRNACACIGVVLLVLVIIIAIRTATFSVRSDSVRSCRLTDNDFIRATDEVIGRFQTALRFKTISTNLHQYDRAELQKMVDFVQSAFPVIHSSSLVTHDVVNNYSLLYKVQGSNPALRPYMLCAHLDVVPVNRDSWEEDPFGANIKDGFIYARGTIDVKQIVMGVMEATEFLLKSGHVPKRTFYIAFGHDEEVNGLDGAAKISELLYSRGVRDLEFLIDEGTTIVNKLFPGVNIPIAVVGTSEKGSLSLELSVTGVPGHSSMPEGETTIATLARAITRLEENPHPNMFGTGPEKDLFTHLASDLSLPFRAVVTNLWLFGPLVSRLFSRIPSLNAIVRTVTSVTMVNGGVKVNVLPPSATAMVNHRIHPAQTVKEVMEYDRKLINDERVKIRVVSSMEPHPMSPYGDEDFGYQTIKNSIRQIWSNATVVPGSHGVHGTLTTVDVEPCPAEPCALPHGKNITLRATFTPSVDSNTFKSSVHGIILGLPVPYGVPHGSMSGPIVSGQEVTYTNTLYVSPAYPQIRLNVEWEVLDDHKRDLFCFIIPVHITSH